MMGVWARRAAVATAASATIAASVVALPETARAASLVVTTIADGNDGACDDHCSLREAVVAANSAAGPDVISLAAGTYVLTVPGPGEDAASTGDLDVTDELTIVGAGAGVTSVDGNDIDRVFEVLRDAQLTMRDVTVRGGYTDGRGGGIFAGGTLSLTRSVVTDNIATGEGGGIAMFYTSVTLEATTVSDNEAADGGGIASDGGGLHAMNSTVSGNLAVSGSGDGILNRRDARTFLTFSTVAENEGAAFVAVSNAGTFSPRSSILAGSEDGGPACLSPPLLGDSAYSVASDGTCALDGPGDQVADPLLNPLAWSGGPTRTMTPISGSAAIDRVPAGTNGCGTTVSTDQRGMVRPQKGGCDSGSVEVEGTHPAPGACVPPPAGLRAWWTFDETTGPIAYDIAGAPNHGEYSGGPTPVAGKVANALGFDGSNDFVRVDHHADLLLGHGMTVDAWVRTTAARGIQTIVDKRDEIISLTRRQRGYAMFLDEGRLALRLADGYGGFLGGTSYVAPDPNVADGTWHHVAATANRFAPRKLVLYVDGQPVKTVYGADVQSGNLWTVVPLRIGRPHPIFPLFTGTPYFEGVIDEVEIFDRSLSGEEVRSLYEAGPSGKCKPQSAELTNLQSVGSLDQGMKVAARKCGGQPYFRYVGGNPDNFAAPEDPAYRSMNLGLFDSGPRAHYDDPTPNRWFGDSFDLEDNREVCYALVHMTMQQNNGQATNDNLYIGHVEDGVSLPTAFTTQVASVGAPVGAVSGPVTFLWSFTAPGLSGLSAITSSSSPDDAVLDFYVQDDTTVDHIMLWVWYHP